MGELVVPKKYKKLVMNSDGTLKEVEFTVSGRKIPPTEIRKKKSWTGLRSLELYRATPMRNMGR